jgi:Exopolysaccharide synthesis, ExoD
VTEADATLEPNQPVHTSDLVKRLIDEAPKDKVDLGWLLGHLQKRAFGLLLLILAIAILVPGLGIPAGFAIAFPAVEMMLGRDRPTFSRLLTKRSFATQRFTKCSTRAVAHAKGRRAGKPITLARAASRYQTCHRPSGAIACHFRHLALAAH